MNYAIILLALIAIYQHFRITYVRNQWTKLLLELKDGVKLQVLQLIAGHLAKEMFSGSNDIQSENYRETNARLYISAMQKHKENQSLKDAVEYLNSDEFKQVVVRAKAMHASPCFDLAENPIPKYKGENSFKLVMDKAMRGIITSEEAYKEYEANRNK